MKDVERKENYNHTMFLPVNNRSRASSCTFVDIALNEGTFSLPAFRTFPLRVLVSGGSRLPMFPRTPTSSLSNSILTCHNCKSLSKSKISRQSYYRGEQNHTILHQQKKRLQLQINTLSSKGLYCFAPVLSTFCLFTCSLNNQLILLECPTQTGIVTVQHIQSVQLEHIYLPLVVLFCCHFSHKQPNHRHQIHCQSGWKE